MKISSIFYFLADLHAKTGWDPDVGAAFKKIGTSSGTLASKPLCTIRTVRCGFLFFTVKKAGSLSAACNTIILRTRRLLSREGRGL